MKKIVSILVTTAMVIGMVLPVAAQEQTTPVIMIDGGSLTVDNDVHVESGNAVNVMNGSVTVNGSVKVDGTGIGAVAQGEGSEVTVTGNASAGDSTEENRKVSKGVTTENGAAATVNGDASAGSGNKNNSAYGVYALNNSSINVDGSAYAGVNDGEEYGYGVFAGNNCNVSIGGDAYAGELGTAVEVSESVVTVGGSAFVSETTECSAVRFTGDSSVYVGKDVKGTYGAVIKTSKSKNGELIVEGMLSGSYADIGITVTGGSNELPEIVVGSLGKNVVAGNNLVPAETVFEKIKYIIKAKGLKVASIMNNDGVEKEQEDWTYSSDRQDKEFMVANETDKIRLVIDPVEEGFRIDTLNFGKYVTEAVQNEDGSWTVTVARGGDLNFEATFVKIPDVKPDDDQKDTSKQAAAVKKTASRTAYTVGSQIWINGHIWIITDINKDTDVWSLSCIDTMTEEQIADPDETLKQYLTEDELNCVIPDEISEKLSSLAEQEVADKYFEGDVNHLSIKCYRNIINY